MKIFDAHLDILAHSKDFPRDFLAGWRQSQVDLPKMIKAQINFAFFSIFEANPKKRNLKRYLHLVSKTKKFFENDRRFKLILKTKDLKIDKEIGIILHLEGADAINKISDLEILFKSGTRSIGPAFDEKNKIVGSIKDGRGLTVLGKKVVKKMNDLKMIIDVSHANEMSFKQIINISKGPVVATHCNIFSLVPNPRNLKENQLRKICQKGGVVGIFFSSPFLNTKKRAKISDIIKHIDFVVKKFGSRYVGIGSDFGGILSGTPKDLKDISEMQKITQALEKKGYSKNKISDIMTENWLRVIRKIMS